MQFILAVEQTRYSCTFNKYFKENDFINILHPIIEKVDNEFIDLYSLGAGYYPNSISVALLSEDYVVILREKSKPIPALMYENFDDKTKAQLFSDSFDKDIYDISVKHIKIEE